MRLRAALRQYDREVREALTLARAAGDAEWLERAKLELCSESEASSPTINDTPAKPVVSFKLARQAVAEQQRRSRSTDRKGLRRLVERCSELRDRLALADPSQRLAWQAQAAHAYDQGGQDGQADRKMRRDSHSGSRPPTPSDFLRNTNAPPPRRRLSSWRKVDSTDDVPAGARAVVVWIPRIQLRCAVPEASPAPEKQRLGRLVGGLRKLWAPHLRCYWLSRRRDRWHGPVRQAQYPPPPPRRPPHRRRQTLLDACALAAKSVDSDTRARLIETYSPPQRQQWQCHRLRELVGRLPPRRLCKREPPRTPGLQPAPAGGNKSSGRSQNQNHLDQNVNTAQPAPPKKRKKKSKKKSKNQLQQVQPPPSGGGQQVLKVENSTAKNKDQTKNKGARQVPIQSVATPKKQNQTDFSSLGDVEFLAWGLSPCWPLRQNEEAPAVPKKRKKQKKGSRKTRNGVSEESRPLKPGFLNLNLSLKGEPAFQFKVLS